MKILTGVSAVVKLALACFLIGFGCGFWFAGKVSFTDMPDSPVAAAETTGVCGYPGVSGWTGAGPA